MKMIQKGLFRVCFQPITMMNCCTTCILWEIGSYNTQQSRHKPHFCRTFVAILSRNPQYDFPKMRWGGSKAVWNFSENSSVLETPSVPKTCRDDLKTIKIGHCGSFSIRFCIILPGRCMGRCLPESKPPRERSWTAQSLRSTWWLLSTVNVSQLAGPPVKEPFHGVAV